MSYEFVVSSFKIHTKPRTRGFVKFIIHNSSFIIGLRLKPDT